MVISFSQSIVFWSIWFDIIFFLLYKIMFVQTPKENISEKRVIFRRYKIPMLYTNAK